MNTDLRATNIRSKITIFQSLEMIGVELRRGHNTQQIVCPFHDDTKPSARVYDNTGKLFCFTCHKLWDPIQLVMDRYHITFEEAITRMETHFKIDPTKVNLLSTVKYNLTREQIPNLFYLYSYVEDRLIEARFKIGLQKYSRALFALDLFLYHYEKKLISGEDFRKALVELGKVATNATS